MGDCMDFPDTLEEFIDEYSFHDGEGLECISTFRVKQMLDHYFRDLSAKRTEGPV